MDPKKLTKESYAILIDRYVRNEGQRVCPLCSKEDTYDLIPERLALGNDLFVDCSCKSCKESWREYYKLYDIELKDEEGDCIPIDDIPHASTGPMMHQVTLYSWPWSQRCLECVNGELHAEDISGLTALCMIGHTEYYGGDCERYEEAENDPEPDAA